MRYSGVAEGLGACIPSRVWQSVMCTEPSRLWNKATKAQLGEKKKRTKTKLTTGSSEEVKTHRISAPLPPFITEFMGLVKEVGAKTEQSLHRKLNVIVLKKCIFIF